MKKIIDLTMPLDLRTPTYPGDPQIEIEQIANLSKDGWNEKRIHCNTHCGTHVDAPAHMIQGANLDQIHLDQFIGNGVIIDIRTKSIKDCLRGKKIAKNSVVLFLTGQSDQRYKKYYQKAKFLTVEIAQELVKRKVKAIGIDSFSPDQEPYPIHKILLPKNILIIENLINLKLLLGKKFTIQFFPLRITEGDGSPCRAIAMVK